MARHLLHRFLLTWPALWLVLTLVFLLIHIVPGDPVEQMLGEGAAPGQVEQLRHTLGLDQPLYMQYGHYLSQIVRGDLGQSFKFQAAVRDVIFERYPATLQLALQSPSRSAPPSPSRPAFGPLIAGAALPIAR
jgi:ABC-type dipeptide/oligopeptide/nickel transport system permease component